MQTRLSPIARFELSCGVMLLGANAILGVTFALGLTEWVRWALAIFCFLNAFHLAPQIMEERQLKWVLFYTVTFFGAIAELFGTIDNHPLWAGIAAPAFSLLLGVRLWAVTRRNAHA